MLLLTPCARSTVQVVRRNDTSALSINEWTGEKTLRWVAAVQLQMAGQQLHEGIARRLSGVGSSPQLHQHCAQSYPACSVIISFLVCRDEDIPDGIEPAGWQPVGNYAVQVRPRLHGQPHLAMDAPARLPVLSPVAHRAATSFAPIGCPCHVQITWPDGFSQIASYELLDSLPRLSSEEAAARQQQRAAAAAAAGGSGGVSAAQQILQNARSTAPPS